MHFLTFWKVLVLRPTRWSVNPERKEALNSIESILEDQYLSKVLNLLRIDETYRPRMLRRAKFL